MTYSVKIKASAAKALDRVPRADRLRLVEAIDRLSTSPYSGSVLKGEFQGLRRLRVGDYRVVYEVFEGELLILVVRIAQRGKVYR